MRKKLPLRKLSPKLISRLNLEITEKPASADAGFLLFIGMHRFSFASFLCGHMYFVQKHSGFYPVIMRFYQLSFV